jgi:sirohydrochlorin ferrochelatase
LCDDGLEFVDEEKLLKDFKEDDKKVVLLPLEVFDGLLSVTVFHEVSTVIPYHP